MASNKKENLKEMSVEELKKKCASLENELHMIKFKAEGAKSKNVKESANIRKQIARILTEINNR